MRNIEYVTLTVFKVEFSHVHTTVLQNFLSCKTKT